MQSLLLLGRTRPGGGGARMALVWLEDLWDARNATGEHKWPESRLVAQTTLDPVQAACAFAACFLDEAQAALAQDLVLARKEKHRGDFLTFRAEFVHVASMIDARVLLLIIGQGGQVKSVELCAPGETPRVLTEKEAQEAFASGALAIAIDFESARTIRAYAWALSPLRLVASVAGRDVLPEAPQEATGPLADAAVNVCKGNAETRKRIERARARMRTTGLW